MLDWFRFQSHFLMPHETLETWAGLMSVLFLAGRFMVGAMAKPRDLMTGGISLTFLSFSIFVTGLAKHHSLCDCFGCCTDQNNWVLKLNTAFKRVHKNLTTKSQQFDAMLLAKGALSQISCETSSTILPFWEGRTSSSVRYKYPKRNSKTTSQQGTMSFRHFSP